MTEEEARSHSLAEAACLGRPVQAQPPDRPSETACLGRPFPTLPAPSEVSRLGRPLHPAAETARLGLSAPAPVPLASLAARCVREGRLDGAAALDWAYAAETTRELHWLLLELISGQLSHDATPEEVARLLTLVPGYVHGATRLPAFCRLPPPRPARRDVGFVDPEAAPRRRSDGGQRSRPAARGAPSTRARGGASQPRRRDASSRGREGGAAAVKVDPDGPAASLAPAGARARARALSRARESPACALGRPGVLPPTGLPSARVAGSATTSASAEVADGPKPRVSSAGPASRGPKAPAASTRSVSAGRRPKLSASSRPQTSASSAKPEAASRACKTSSPVREALVRTKTSASSAQAKAKRRPSIIT
jgi:hypothetical protein